MYYDRKLPKSKRLRKKKMSWLKDKRVFYLRLEINENLEYCPIIKCKGMNKFMKTLKEKWKIYNCDVSFKCPDMDREHEKFLKELEKE